MCKKQVGEPPHYNGSSSLGEVKQAQRWLTEVNMEWRLETSDFGPGWIKAHAKVAEAPIIDLTLQWSGDHEQPEVWEIRWWHHPDYILGELPDYLLRCCPVPLEGTHPIIGA
jgi:hypothetical protein